MDRSIINIAEFERELIQERMGFWHHPLRRHAASASGASPGRRRGSGRLARHPDIGAIAVALAGGRGHEIFGYRIALAAALPWPATREGWRGCFRLMFGFRTTSRRRAETVHTGIWKRRVQGRRAVRRLQRCRNG